VVDLLLQLHGLGNRLADKPQPLITRELFNPFNFPSVAVVHVAASVGCRRLGCGSSFRRFAHLNKSAASHRKDRRPTRRGCGNVPFFQPVRIALSDMPVSKITSFRSSSSREF
jgi:hypothetical protein